VPTKVTKVINPERAITPSITNTENISNKSRSEVRTEERNLEVK
jgi:hypothetical protein